MKIFLEYLTILEYVYEQKYFLITGNNFRIRIFKRFALFIIKLKGTKKYGGNK